MEKSKRLMSLTKLGKFLWMIISSWLFVLSASQIVVGFNTQSDGDMQFKGDELLCEKNEVVSYILNPMSESDFGNHTDSYSDSYSDSHTDKD